MLPGLHQPSPGAAWETTKLRDDEIWMLGSDQYLLCCATLGQSLSNWAPLGVHLGTHTDFTMLKDLDISREGLPLLLAIKGPMRAAGIGLHLLPARDYEKPWLHSNIYLEGLGYPRASSQGTSWECWAFTDPPSGWEQPRPTRTGVLDPGLWTLPSVPGRTTTHPRLNEVGTSWLFSKKVKTRHNPAKQAAADKNTISQKHPEKCVRFLSVQSLSGPCLAPKAHGQASLVFLPRSQEEHAEGLPCNRAGRTKAASLLPLPLNTGGTRSSAHIHLAG